MSNNLNAAERSTKVARRNANDALGVLEVASGALRETNSIFKRMRELSVQAANEPLANTERQHLETEFRQLSSELTRLRDTTEFNGITVMDGSQSNRASITASSTGSVLLKPSTVFIDSVELKGAKSDGVSSHEDNNNSALAKANAINFSSSSHGVHAQAFNQQTATFGIRGASPHHRLSINGVRIADGAITVQDRDSDGTLRNAINAKTDQHGVWADITDAGQLILTAVDGRNITLGEGTAAGFVVSPLETLYGSLSLTSQNTFRLKGGAALGLSDGMIVAGDGLSTQIGVHNTSNDRLTTGLDSNSAFGALQLDQLSLTSRAAAQQAIQFIDFGIDHTNQQQAGIGTAMNRLDSTINLLTSNEQEMAAAGSQIADADMAFEASQLARANILRTASESVLAQAKDLSNVTLQLIR